MKKHIKSHNIQYNDYNIWFAYKVHFWNIDLVCELWWIQNVLIANVYLKLETYFNKVVKKSGVECFRQSVTCEAGLLRVQSDRNALSFAPPFTVHDPTCQFFLHAILRYSQKIWWESKNCMGMMEDGKAKYEDWMHL